MGCGTYGGGGGTNGKDPKKLGLLNDFAKLDFAVAKGFNCEPLGNIEEQNHLLRIVSTTVTTVSTTVTDN